MLLKLLDAITNATLSAMGDILKVIPVAKVIPSPGNTLFEVVHNGHSFPLSVVSACSGVNSVVGFLLIGSAFAAVVRGPIVRKVLWLMGGMLILWVINLGRITFIFWAGKTWGEYVAIDILHPFIGLVTFGIGVVSMIVCIRPLGMHIDIGGVGWRYRLTFCDQTPSQSERWPCRRSTRPSLWSLCWPSSWASPTWDFVPTTLWRTPLESQGSCRTRRLLSHLRDGSPIIIDEFNWAKPLFGDTSTWYRYSLLSSSGGQSPHLVPVVVDVIDSPDLDSFSAYGVEACYQFHGYSLSDVAQVRVGGGITGQSLSYTSQQFGSWSIVYWIVPVKSGTSTYYERVVLYVKNTGQGIRVQATNTQADIQNLAGSIDSNTPDGKQLIENRAFLVAFAREMILAQAQRGAKVA